jgi:hypothetical protein
MSTNGSQTVTGRAGIKSAMLQSTQPQESFKVRMLNARHNDGRVGDAYIGNDFQFSTLDPLAAHVFSRFDADRFADHWRGWYRGFAGGCTIEVVQA